MFDFEKQYNKGNDCDCCVNQYYTGRDGTVTGCKRALEGLDCDFREIQDNQ